MPAPDLADVALRFRAALPPGQLDVFRIDPLDRLGVFVVQASLVPDDGGVIYTGTGYGVSFAEAEVSAVAELCEEVHVGRALVALPRVMGDYATLVRERGANAVIDPLHLCLPAGGPYTPHMPLEWAPLRRYRDGAAVLFPVEFIAAYSDQIAPGPRLITPLTNGLGAGSSIAQALAHGLLELHQRDGNVLSFRALDRGVTIEPDAVEDASTRALLALVKSNGIAVAIKLASTDFGMTNLYVVGDDPSGAPQAICVTACGEAAHPDRERALRKALLEFIGSRSRKVATHGPLEALRAISTPAYFDRNLGAVDLAHEEPRALAAMCDWLTRDAASLRALLRDTVLSRRENVMFSHLPTVPAGSVDDPDTRLALIVARLAQEGLEPYYLDATPDPENWLKVIKVVVPGLECETMSYHRIGRRGVARLRQRNDPLLLTAPRAGAERILLTPQDEAALGGPVWFDAARADAIVGALYPLYREPGMFAARVALAQEAAQ